MPHRSKALLKEYEQLTDINAHTEAALLLVNLFGSQEEKEALILIAIKQNAQGFLSMEDSHKRFEISNKYYKIIKPKT